jgi:MoaA/NifB/PqqE/SkfB family radical SAM enzyme
MAKSNTGDYCKATARLIWNGLKFRGTRLMKAVAKPTVISLAVTNRCNSHCVMCNIWKRASEEADIKSREMSREQIISILSHPLLSEVVELDLTGGELHLRDDLADIAIAIGILKQSALPRLRSLIITTNGLLPPRIIANYRRILESLRGTDIDLVSVNSIDGIGATHDLIRGTRGAFELATQTLDGLMELRAEYPNFIIGIKTTILPDNVNVLGAILDFALERELFHIISPALFTEARFRNLEKRDALALSTTEYEAVLEFYRLNRLRTDYFYSTTRGFLATGRKRWTCAALYNYLFIDFDGTVYPCEIIAEPIGNVKEQDLVEIWHGTSACHWRHRIGKVKCCLTCHEPGAIRYSAYAGGWSYLKFLAALGRREFDKTYYRGGFWKYFSR